MHPIAFYIIYCPIHFYSRESQKTFIHGKIYFSSKGTVPQEVLKSSPLEEQSQKLIGKLSWSL